jgi:hypothetical protein
MPCSGIDCDADEVCHWNGNLREQAHFLRRLVGGMAGVLNSSVEAASEGERRIFAGFVAGVRQRNPILLLRRTLPSGDH